MEIIGLTEQEALACKDEVIDFCCAKCDAQHLPWYRPYLEQIYENTVRDVVYFGLTSTYGSRSAEIAEALAWVRLSQRCFQAALEATAKAFEMSPASLTGRSRTQSVALARHVLYHVLYEHTGASYPEIGRRMRRHHATVIHGVQQSRQAAAEDEAYAARVAHIASVLQSYQRQP